MSPCTCREEEAEKGKRGLGEEEEEEEEEEEWLVDGVCVRIEFCSSEDGGGEASTRALMVPIYVI